MVKENNNYLFIGSQKLKEKVKDELLQEKFKYKKNSQLINILEDSELAYPFPIYSKDITWKEYSMDENDFIEKLTIRICKELKKEFKSIAIINEVDQFYQSIFYILSLAVNRFFYAKQLNLKDKTILIPNIVKKKRPFSTMDIILLHQQDEFNSYILLECIFSLFNKNKIKSINLNNKEFNIFENSYYEKLNNKNLTYTFKNLKKSFDLITKINKSNKKIYLADNSFGFVEFIKYFGRYEFIEFDNIWLKLLNIYNFTYKEKSINIIGKNFDLNNDLYRFLKHILNSLLPFSVMKSPKYIGDIVKRTKKSPILSSNLFFYDDCLRSVLGQRNGKYNYLVDHGGSCFNKTSHAGQFKYSQSKFVSSSLVNSGNIHLHKPIYIKAINPLINFSSFLTLSKYKLDIKLKNLSNKKPIALVIPKTLVYYNCLITSSPQGYKEQLENFEAATRLIEKLINKGYFVIYKLQGNLSDVIKNNFKIYSPIYNQCYFLDKSINLVDALELADINFVTYPMTGLAQTLYKKKLAILAAPLKLWKINEEIYPLVSKLLYERAYIDTSENRDFEILNYKDYKRLFKSKKIKSYVSDIYDLAFSHKKYGCKPFI